MAVDGTAPSHEVTSTSDDIVLAVFEGGVVRRSDVEREIRFLPKDERRFRQAQGRPQAEQWRDWTRRVALRQVAMQRMGAEPWGADPWLREKARQAARDWGLQRWRARCYGLPYEDPGDEELLAKLPPEGKESPARLRLSHIFLAADGNDAVQEAEERLRSWRREISDLSSFRRLAKERSESQSALKDGKLGYLRKGWLPKAAEEVLYALPEGSISEPIVLRGGVHLFFVEKNEPAKIMPRDRELRRLRAQIRHESLQACRGRRLAQDPVPETATDLLGAAIRVGSWSLSRDLVERIYGRPNETLEAVARRLWERETLYQQALATEQFDASERRRLDDLQANNYFGALVKTERAQYVQEPTAEDVEAAYRSRPDAFKSPLRMSLWVATSQVSDGEDPLAFLRRYETLAAQLADGSQRWPDLAAAPPPGVAIEHFDDIAVMDLGGKTSPFLMSHVAPLDAGNTTGVLQDGEHFYIVHILERRSPTRRPLADVEEQIRRRLMKERHRQASAQAMTALLEASQFSWTAEGLAHLESLAAKP